MGENCLGGDRLLRCHQKLAAKDPLSDRILEVSFDVPGFRVSGQYKVCLRVSSIHTQELSDTDKIRGAKGEVSTFWVEAPLTEAVLIPLTQIDQLKFQAIHPKLIRESTKAKAKSTYRNAVSIAR